VLIIDDDPRSRSALAIACEAMRHRVTSTESLTRALELAGHLPLDMALIGMRSEFEQSVDLLSRLRQVRPGLPVVVVAVEPTVEGAVTAMRRGAFDYIAKPANPDVLSDVLAKLVESRRQSSSDTQYESLNASHQPIEVGAPVTVDELVSEHIRRVLATTNTVQEAAAILGIDPSTVWRRRKRSGL
jgi:DNA-binding NtrC family response regulator